MVTTARKPLSVATPAPNHLRPLVRRAALITASGSALVALLLGVPSLASVRDRLASVNRWWLAAAIVLEIGSCVSFVAVFRAFFDRIPGKLARRIAWIEMASGALLPGGGVTSYALGGLLLSTAGMDRPNILTRSGGLFWLTSGVNAVALITGGSLMLAAGPRDGAMLAWICAPVLIVAILTALIAASPWLVRSRPSLISRGWLVALIDGVADGWRAARDPSLRLLGAPGYLVLDMAVLWCLFRGLGYDASPGALMLGYLIGYLATTIPVPAGVGVLEGGMVGMLVLYGTPPALAASAVLLYHAIAFWIPSLGGTVGWIAVMTDPRSPWTPLPHRRQLHASVPQPPNQRSERS
jgi:uncharacterized membrane protein YbhN (UPF0104 family)